jgi:indolepyruvate ferredoxin oxidoreductase, beta subunit
MIGTFSLLITGVGGQGVLTVSRIIAMAASKGHEFVSRTEARGLSQRGGSVTSEVRFGDIPISPAIRRGTADLIFALDALEAARALPLLAAKGSLVTNGAFTVPAHLLATWRQQNAEEKNYSKLKLKITDIFINDGRAMIINPEYLTKKSGELNELNLVLLGALSPLLPISPDIIVETLRQCVSSTASFSFAMGRRLMLERGLRASTASRHTIAV